jgi:hypothetical protein
MEQQDLAREDWRGQLAGSPAPVTLELGGLLGVSRGGGSQSFPALDRAGERWNVKAPNNPQGGRVVCTEHLVSAAGRLIGAPVCEVQPIRITEEFVGITFPNGLLLAAGVGSASREVPDVVEERDLAHRDRDDNASRHVGVFALYDWCWGADGQWSVRTSDDNRLFSHDHGWYFPPEGPDWNEGELVNKVDVPRELAKSAAGLDLAEIDRVAYALEAVTREHLRSILLSVPSEWAVPNDDLEAVGFFLERRAPAVAARMRATAAKLTQS